MEVRKSVTKNREIYIFKPLTKICVVTSHLPRNVCVCKYHENFINTVNGLHKVKSSIPKYDESFTVNIVCDMATEECWFNKCSTCMNGNLF